MQSEQQIYKHSCGKQYKAKGWYERHLKTCTFNEEQDLKQRTCEKCGKVYKSPIWAQKHQEKCPGKKQKKQPKEPKEKKQKAVFDDLPKNLSETNLDVYLKMKKYNTDDFYLLQYKNRNNPKWVIELFEALFRPRRIEGGFSLNPLSNQAKYSKALNEFVSYYQEYSKKHDSHHKQRYMELLYELLNTLHWSFKSRWSNKSDKELVKKIQNLYEVKIKKFRDDTLKLRKQQPEPGYTPLRWGEEKIYPYFIRDDRAYQHKPINEY